MEADDMNTPGTFSEEPFELSAEHLIPSDMFWNDRSTTHFLLAAQLLIIVTATETHQLMVITEVFWGS